MSEKNLYDSGFQDIFIHGDCPRRQRKHQLDDSLKLAIDEIIELAIEENLSALDAKYVCEAYGVFEIFRIGVPDLLLNSIIH